MKKVWRMDAIIRRFAARLKHLLDLHRTPGQTP
jgi:hypothetical protein